MILDAHNLFSDAQAVTAAAASDNYYNMGLAGRKIGVGEPLFIVVQCDVAMTDGSSDSTLAVTLQQDDNTSFTSATDVQTIGTFAATSAIGTRIVAPINPGVVTEQYVRLYYTPANGNLSTGSFTAFITHDIDAYNAFEAGFTIS